MNYLVNWFKRNGLFFALSTLVASFSALFSVKHFLLLGIVIVWLLYRKFPWQFLAAVVLWSGLCFLYFEWRLVEDTEAPQLPIEMTWTQTYKINGDQLRGFMKTTEGEKIYVIYEFTSEEEKQKFSVQSLTGTLFLVTAGEWEDAVVKPLSHRYSFSMASYLKSKNAKGTLEITTWQYIGTQKSLLKVLADYRFMLNRHIEENFPQSLAAEAQALLFGDQQHVDQDLNRAYQKLGITHLFAISGLHVALLSVFLYEVLIRLGVRIQLANTIIMVALPVYAMLAGSAPSVWRSVLLVEILHIVRLLNGRVGVEDSLAIAFIVSLLWQPAMVLQVGFQLSYIACMSLVYSGKLLNKYTLWWQQGFFMTFVCQLLAYPILLYHFYELSLSSFFANIVFVPLFSFVILPINVGLLVVTFISSWLAGLLFTIYEPLRTGLTTLIVEMQQVPYQLWVPGKPTIIIVCVLVTTVIVSFVLMEQRKWLLAAIVVLVPATLFSMRHVLQQELIVTFVDVGQGDCIVIELPHRRGVYVMDSGGLLRFGEKDWRSKVGNYEVGKQVVVPFLKGKGISSIDALILSHADADHVEGAEEVLEEIRAREIHISPNSAANSAMVDVNAEAIRQKIPFVEKLAGDAWQVNDVKFAYIWPQETEYEGNNDSLVLQLDYGAFRALITGDLEEEGELELVKNNSLQPVTVLKAGHHGSKTSSSEPFIKALQPQLTIFTAGKNNRYNHPHPDVTKRFEVLGYETISTKEQGTIVVSSDGVTTTVQIQQ